MRQPCDHYLIIVFSADVPGTPVTVRYPGNVSYDCHGPLVPLGTFHTREFFISPLDLSWTVVHTHEDYAFGGPYFILSEWIVGDTA